MRAEFFNIQYRRLQARFGDKAFDSEFAKLLAKELSDQDDYDMQRVVDNFVGSRRHNQAPLLAEFREEFLRLQKYKPDFKTDQAPDCHVCDGSGCTFHFKF